MAAAYEFGSGPDTLVLRLTQDFFEEDARVNVGLDGANVAEWLAVDAVRGSGEATTVTIKGDWMGEPWPLAYVSFINDRWGGSEDTDRNVYLEGASINGVAVEGVATGLFSAGETTSFYFDPDAVAPAPTPDPEPPVVTPPPAPVPGQAINGTSGADSLYGGAGPDTIQGYGGDDVLVGKEGADILRGGAGSDVLTGGLGDDVLTLASGRDVVIYTPGDGKDTVTDFVDGSDSLWLGGGVSSADVADATRGGTAGALLTFAGDTASEVWFPGVTADQLGFVTIIA